jgi:hypothetical protein
MANAAEAAFIEADLNRDGYLSEGEFRSFLARNSISSNTGNNQGASGYGSSSFLSPVYEASTSGGGGLGGNLAYNAAGFGSAGYGSSSSSYRSSVGNIGGDLGNLNVAGAAAGISTSDAASASFSSVSQSTTAQQYETDAQGNFKDPNPQVVRRPAQGGPLTYSQNIRVRFLQPPAAPPPGVSSIYTYIAFIYCSF